MENSKIAWTDHTLNPWIGCMKVSEGCANCYAEQFVVRGRLQLKVWGPPATTPRNRTAASTWKQPLRWNAAAAREGKRTKVFCASLADVFEDHPSLPPWRAELFELIEKCTHLDWQLLTKRPEHIAQMLPAPWLESPRPHVWLGTTVENQEQADARVDTLVRVPAAVRFLSVEPMLGPVLLPVRAGIRTCTSCGVQFIVGAPANNAPCPADIAENRGCTGKVRQGIDWVIIGGESGTKSRSFDLAWGRDLLYQCQGRGIPVFMKQLGSNPANSAYRTHPLPVPVVRDKKGGDPLEWPADLRVQSFPTVAA